MGEEDEQMKKQIFVIFCLVVAVFSFNSAVYAGGDAPKKAKVSKNKPFPSVNTEDKDFNLFFDFFSATVREGEGGRIWMLMSEDFEWAYDGIVPQARALQLMKELGVWSHLKGAVSGKINVVKEAPEQYSIWSKSKKQPTGFIFTKVNGYWKWSALRAD